MLQLIAANGATIGFAKLGTGPLTRRLVRAETVALTALSHVDLPTVDVPTVLHTGQWHGHQVLVQSALPVASALIVLAEATHLVDMISTRQVATAPGGPALADGLH